MPITIEIRIKHSHTLRPIALPREAHPELRTSRKLGWRACKWRLVDLGRSDDVTVLMYVCRVRDDEQAFDESQGPAAFFCISDSVVVVVVVKSSAVSWWQGVFRFATVVRHRRHCWSWCGRE
jgi:hypothetical protein